MAESSTVAQSQVPQRLGGSSSNARLRVGGERDSIHRDRVARSFRRLLGSRIIVDARPFPILRPRHPPRLHRVQMNVAQEHAAKSRHGRHYSAGIGTINLKSRKGYWVSEITSRGVSGVLDSATPFYRLARARFGRLLDFSCRAARTLPRIVDRRLRRPR